MSGILSKKVAKVIPVWLILLSATLVSAGVLKYFVTIHGTVRVEQAVVFSDGSTEKTFSFNGATVTGGDTYIDLVGIKNRASVPATVKFKTSISGPGCPGDTCGITTSYWKLVGYSDIKTTPDGSGSIPATITVEDLGDAVKWTIDMDETSGFFKNGHAAVGLIIGVGDRILFQVHSNDGTCPEYDWGTWLYSPYDSTGDGWYGWHTSEAEWNTPVDEMTEINATGSRYISENPKLIFTITISKKLLHPGEFKWAIVLMGDTSDTFSPGTFSWTNTDTTNFHTAIVGTKIQEGEPFTIDAGETLTFGITNEFAVALEPGTYTITTEIQPAEGE